jgi:hypothetical protein
MEWQRYLSKFTSTYFISYFFLTNPFLLLIAILYSESCRE